MVKAAHDSEFTKDIGMMICVVIFNKAAFDGHLTLVGGSFVFRRTHNCTIGSAYGLMSEEAGLCT